MTIEILFRGLSAVCPGKLIIAADLTCPTIVVSAVDVRLEMIISSGVTRAINWPTQSYLVVSE